MQWIAVSAMLVVGAVWFVAGFLKSGDPTESLRAVRRSAVVPDGSGRDVVRQFHGAMFEQQPEEGGPGRSDDQRIDLAVAVGADRAVIEEGLDR